MLNVLITGALGQLGRSFQRNSYDFPEMNLLLKIKDDLDITDLAAVNTFFEKNNLVYCVNTAAYTQVDLAEKEKKQAEKINIQGVENLAIVCKAFNVPLIHISTDYVYDPRRNRPLKETTPLIPVNHYGFTKKKGEVVLKDTWDQHLIFRTSWLYSPFRKNFLKTMIKLGLEKNELNVVQDQTGSPTYAGDLAHAILQIISDVESGKFTINEIKGTYNYSNEGQASWYDFARMIFKIYGLNIKVKPINTSAYPTPAARPHYSVLDNSSFRKTFSQDVPWWVDSLENCINDMKKREKSDNS
jgi:dTDP-4-dehydrorhamnose reductase